MCMVLVKLLPYAPDWAKQDAKAETTDAALTQTDIEAFRPQGQGITQEAGSVGQAAQQQTPAGDPMETTQDGEASAQPMETSQAAPAQQEDTAGPSEPGASCV